MFFDLTEKVIERLIELTKKNEIIWEEDYYKPENANRDPYHCWRTNIKDLEILVVSDRYMIFVNKELAWVGIGRKKWRELRRETFLNCRREMEKERREEAKRIEGIILS